ncbi:TIGR04222 domain-containing membrane protein [Yinghuangia sp. YIM S10712]|uniref:TIGR04222 domain-containing membrane protein n=1 Tax=Yinghuangia sp. YIM S10712 TaxID=3436930 RepID=UPI003F5359E7
MIGFIISALLFVAVCAYAVNVHKQGKARRAPAPPPGTLGLYELAYLAGGPARTADVALLAAQARGTLSIAGNGHVAVQRQDNADALATDVLGAVQASGAGADLASARATLADRPSVRTARDRLFELGFLNPSARNPQLRPARVGLGVVPVIAIAGLFLEPYAGSPSDDTAIWVTNLVLVLFGTAACAGAAMLLFSRYTNLRGPLTDSAIHYLWSQVRDEQGLTALAAMPGGAGLGKVALAGPAVVTDPAVSGAFGQAAQATSGRIVSDGWTESQWANNANVQGPLVGPSYFDLHRQASTPLQGNQPQPPHVPGPNLGFQVPPGVPPHGGHSAPQYNAYTDGPPVWENTPGVSGDAPGGHDGGGEPT